jgi:hypothetical protein
MLVMHVRQSYQSCKPKVIQGGALRTYPIEPKVDSVAVLIKTDRRPLKCKGQAFAGTK